MNNENKIKISTNTYDNSSSSSSSKYLHNIISENNCPRFNEENVKLKHQQRLRKLKLQKIFSKTTTMTEKAAEQQHQQQHR